MKILSWNVRGLNDPTKVVAVKRLINEYYISIVGLLETKVKFHKMQTI